MAYETNKLFFYSYYVLLKSLFILIISGNLEEEKRYVKNFIVIKITTYKINAIKNIK